MTQDSESVVVPRVPTEAMLRAPRYGVSENVRAEIWSAMIAAAPSTSVREEAITAAIAKADEDFGYRFNLTRLVDGEETHTLFMDGFEPVEFDDRDDGYRLIAERRNKARATAVLAALVPSTDEGQRHG